LVILGLLGVAANAFPQLATGWPATGYQWALLAFGALADAVLVALSLDRLLVVSTAGWALVRRLRWPVRRRLLVTLMVACSLLIGVGFAATNVWFRVDRQINGCPEPTELRLLTTVAGLAPSRTLAADFEQATLSSGCRTVSVYVYAADPARALDALAGGWSIDAVRDLGPRPDVWLPDSRSQQDDLVARISANASPTPIAESRSIARSPIVVGIAQAATDGLTAPRDGLSWSNLRLAVAGLSGGLVRPDPDTSPVGAIATTALYADLRPADGESTRKVEVAIDRALDTGGYPLGDDLGLLCRQRETHAPTAIVVSEQSLVRFNAGDPLGEGCPVPASVPAKDMLLAYYPSATPSLDHPFVRLRWKAGAPTHPQPQSGAATRLGQWLGTDDGKRALLSVGLRPPGYQISEPLTNALGVLPGALFDQRAQDATALARAKVLYEDARRPGRVLLALDTSGSMKQLTPAGDTRLTVAENGITESLSLMGSTDEFGLWTFPADASGHGVRDRVPIRAGGGTARQVATRHALAGVGPTGGTPLFATIAQGVRTVGAASTDRISALVVLTDGEDTTSAMTPRQVHDAVQRQRVRVFVVAVGEANCANAVLADVTAVTGGHCYPATFDTINATLSQIFTVLWDGTDHAG
jgi:hypothetical protein